MNQKFTFTLVSPQQDKLLGQTYNLLVEYKGLYWISGGMDKENVWFTPIAEPTMLGSRSARGLWFYKTSGRVTDKFEGIALGYLIKTLKKQAWRLVDPFSKTNGRIGIQVAGPRHANKERDKRGRPIWKRSYIPRARRGW